MLKAHLGTSFMFVHPTREWCCSRTSGSGPGDSETCREKEYSGYVMWPDLGRVQLLIHSLSSAREGPARFLILL